MRRSYRTCPARPPRPGAIQWFFASAAAIDAATGAFAFRAVVEVI
jgi:hypothetical protein